MESNNNVAALLHQVKSNFQKHSNLLRIDFTLPGALRLYTLQALILASMSSPLVWEIETDGNHYLEQIQLTMERLGLWSWRCSWGGI